MGQCQTEHLPRSRRHADHAEYLALSVDWGPKAAGSVSVSPQTPTPHTDRVIRASPSPRTGCRCPELRSLFAEVYFLASQCRFSSLHYGNMKMIQYLVSCNQESDQIPERSLANGRVRSFPRRCSSKCFVPVTPTARDNKRKSFRCLD